jgi:hypothetical protein
MVPRGVSRASRRALALLLYSGLGAIPAAAALNPLPEAGDLTSLSLELALSVRDLLSGSHVEFGITEFGDLPSRVEPSASLRLTWAW